MDSASVGLWITICRSASLTKTVDDLFVNNQTVPSVPSVSSCCFIVFLLHDVVCVGAENNRKIDPRPEARHPHVQGDVAQGSTAQETVGRK